MGTTTNYGYNVPVGSDNVNLLPQMAANFPMIDSDLKAVSNTGVGTATELVTGTVHALTRANRDRNVFKFVATSDFEAGETFEVDGVQVTAKTPDGRNLSTGAYVINSSVLCMLDGTLLTVIVNPAKALDSENLDGHPATYFATAAALSALDNQLGAVSSKVGTGVLDVGNDCVDGINKLNTQLSNKAPIGFTFHAEGTGSVSLPANAHELLIYCVYTSVIVPFHLMANYTGSFYGGSNNANWCGARITLSASDVTLDTFYNNGVSVNAVLSVFYR